MWIGSFHEHDSYILKIWNKPWQVDMPLKLINKSIKNVRSEMIYLNDYW